MSDERTDEQREADAAFVEAVTNVVQAYAAEGCNGFVLTDWVLVASTQGWDDEGDAMTAVGTYVDQNAVPPLHRQLGLIEYAAARYRKTIGTEDDD